MRPVFFSKILAEHNKNQNIKQSALFKKNKKNIINKLSTVKDNGSIEKFTIKLDFKQNQLFFQPSNDADTPRSNSTEESKMEIKTCCITQTTDSQKDELGHFKEISVSKWIDITERYGIAYQLSNGCKGILFNDHSKVILNPENKIIYLFSSQNILLQFFDSLNDNLIDEDPDLYRKLKAIEFTDKIINSRDSSTSIIK